MKKLFSLCFVFCILLCAAAAAAEDPAVSVETKTFPLYYDRNGEDPVDPAFTLYFIGGVNDLPYTDVRDIVDLANRLKDAPGFSGLT